MEDKPENVTFIRGNARLKKLLDKSGMREAVEKIRAETEKKK